MEKLIFWEDSKMIETIGSMDEIQGMMDCQTAYRLLRGCCYSHTKYKNLSKKISEIMDHQKCCIPCTPFQAAIMMDQCDKALPVPADIFCFMEKAYQDAYALNTDPRAPFLLGRLYSEERYGHVDYAKAAMYFTEGAKDGDGKAEAMLGKCYLLGWGMPENYELAFQYLTKWALISEENTEALYLLGDMFYEGLYVHKDQVQAYELYQRAWDAEDAQATIGGVQALLRIADYEMKQIGEIKNFRYALTCYQRAETECYQYMLSCPNEATDCMQRAQEGQRVARRKLKNALLKQLK